MCTLFGWPNPTGPYAVGLAAWHLTDHARAEPFRPEPAGPRELMAQVWYPAEPAPDAKPLGATVSFPEAGAWYPKPPVTLVMRQEPVASTLRQLIQRFELPRLAFNQITHLQTHAYPQAPVASAAAAFPVLLFSHGYLLDSLNSNTFLMEELASQGYVVVSLSHPYESLVTVFPDGRLIGLDLNRPRFEQLAAGAPGLNSSLALWVADTRFVLDELERSNAAGPGEPLAGCLDLGRVGVFGVGLGGATAEQVCREDPRCGAGLALAGQPRRASQPANR